MNIFEVLTFYQMKKILSNSKKKMCLFLYYCYLLSIKDVVRWSRAYPNFSSKMVPNLFEARVNGWCVAYHDTKNGAQWVAE